MILCYYLRTAEGEENTTWLNLLESLVIQTSITFECIVESPTMLGKSRWIENNQVVLIACLFKKLKGILAEGLMACVTREIEFYITISEFDGFSTTIDRMHQLSPTPHGIEREATSIAEHIEYTFTTSKSLEQ